MSDRELLELKLAAKAAGFEFAYKLIPEVQGKRRGPFILKGSRWVQWNPRKDDADTLQLAAKLLIQIYPDKDEVEIFHMEIGYIVEPTNGDVIDATRRAIVRAAAEIGRQMNEGEEK